MKADRFGGEIDETDITKHIPLSLARSLLLQRYRRGIKGLNGSRRRVIAMTLAPLGFRNHLFILFFMRSEKRKRESVRKSRREARARNRIYAACRIRARRIKTVIPHKSDETDNENRDLQGARPFRYRESQSRKVKLARSSRIAARETGNGWTGSRGHRQISSIARKFLARSSEKRQSRGKLSDCELTRRTSLSLSLSLSRSRIEKKGICLNTEKLRAPL